VGDEGRQLVKQCKTTRKDAVFRVAKFCYYKSMHILQIIKYV